MANWCSTGVIFYSKDKKTIKKMFEEFTKLVSISNIKRQASNTLFIDRYLHDKKNLINDKGFVDIYSDCVEFNSVYYYFQILHDSVSPPQIGMWYAISKKYNVGLAYVTESPEDDLFLIYDEIGCFYDNKYYVDYEVHNSDPDDDSDDALETPDDKYFGRDDEVCLRAQLEEDFSFLGVEEYDSLQEMIKKITSYISKTKIKNDFFMLKEYKISHPANFVLQ